MFARCTQSTLIINYCNITANDCITRTKCSECIQRAGCAWCSKQVSTASTRQMKAWYLNLGFEVEVVCSFFKCVLSMHFWNVLHKKGTLCTLCSKYRGSTAQGSQTESIICIKSYLCASGCHCVDHAWPQSKASRREENWNTHRKTLIVN